MIKNLAQYFIDFQIDTIKLPCHDKENTLFWKSEIFIGFTPTIKD